MASPTFLRKQKPTKSWALGWLGCEGKKGRRGWRKFNSIFHLHSAVKTMNFLSEEKRPRSNDVKKNQKEEIFSCSLRLCLHELLTLMGKSEMTWVAGLENWSQRFQSWLSFFNLNQTTRRFMNDFDWSFNSTSKDLSNFTTQGLFHKNRESVLSTNLFFLCILYQIFNETQQRTLCS